MRVTLRTVPRSDRSVSVVLTRDPGDERDPEVVEVLENITAAWAFIIRSEARISLQATGRVRPVLFRLRKFPSGKPKAVTMSFDIDLGPGEHLRVI